MEIKASINFPHQFIVKHDRNGNISTEINKWCRENCKSLWFVTPDTTINMYAPCNVENPLGYEKFAPSRSLMQGIMVAFEAEDEAMAFKLSWT